MESQGHMMGRSSQTEIDRANKAFWDELCGTHFAQRLGITDNSSASLTKFDDCFFKFYPYVFDYLPFEQMRAKRVLEVGLGYGSVSQKIAEAGAEFHGLDIAAGPIAMACHRLGLIGVDGDVREGSILSAPFENETFDWIVTIGCLHHTGDTAGAIKEIHRMLKPGGDALIMVYSASSYRQWALTPKATWRRVRNARAARKHQGLENEIARGAYDRNSQGAVAPQTEFTTKCELREMCSAFSECTIKSENINSEGPLKFIPRVVACMLFGSWLGLDLYCKVRK